MISQELIYDEDFNSLSLGAQALFLRMLAVSDDCGVVPANEYTLRTLTNPPKEIQKRLTTLLKEIVGKGLGHTFRFAEKDFFTFKPSSFDRINSYIIAKRTRSEYLNITHDDFVELSKSFLEVLGNSIPNEKSESTSIESIKYKVESIKQKDMGEEAFDVLWSRYPRRDGRKEALKHYKSTVTTPELETKIGLALDSYLAHLRKNKTEPQYVKMGSTWFNNWQDWIPQAQAPKPVRQFKPVMYECEYCGMGHAVGQDCPKEKKDLQSIDFDKKDVLIAIEGLAKGMKI